MEGNNLNIAIVGLSITSSWGNGHATTFRSFIKGLDKKGHKVTFFEKDVPWYAKNRDMPNPEFCDVVLYQSLDELKTSHRDEIESADMVILGSYVQEGVETGKFLTEAARGVTAFYDIDTPVTLGKLERGDYEYLSPGIIPLFDMYLSFTGGPTLDLLENKYGAKRAYPFYCSVDPDLYFPETLVCRRS